MHALNHPRMVANRSSFDWPFDMGSTNLLYLSDDSHPLFAAYRDIRHRNWTFVSGLFIAEGPLLVERLLQSDYGVHSLLVERRYAEQFAELAQPETPVLVVEHEIVEQLVGFNFHRGVLACGFRKAYKTIENELPTLTVKHSDTWLGLFGVNDPENLGGMLRTAAGLGIKNILLGPGTVDPYSRRALRVSMGNTLFLNLFQTASPASTLKVLQQVGLQVISTALTDNSQSLEQANRRGPLIILMGNERHGLPQAILEISDRCVRIDMELGTDSLNVGVAAGIVMHHFCRIARSDS